MLPAPAVSSLLRSLSNSSNSSLRSNVSTAGSSVSSLDSTSSSKRKGKRKNTYRAVRRDSNSKKAEATTITSGEESSAAKTNKRKRGRRRTPRYGVSKRIAAPSPSVSLSEENFYPEWCEIEYVSAAAAEHATSHAKQTSSSSSTRQQPQPSLLSTKVIALPTAEFFDHRQEPDLHTLKRCLARRITDYERRETTTSRATPSSGVASTSSGSALRPSAALQSPSQQAQPSLLKQEKQPPPFNHSKHLGQLTSDRIRRVDEFHEGYLVNNALDYCGFWMLDLFLESGMDSTYKEISSDRMLSDALYRTDGKIYNNATSHKTKDKMKASKNTSGKKTSAARTTLKIVCKKNPLSADLRQARKSDVTDEVLVAPSDRGPESRLTRSEAKMSSTKIRYSFPEEDKRFTSDAFWQWRSKKFTPTTLYSLVLDTDYCEHLHRQEENPDEPRLQMTTQQRLKEILVQHPGIIKPTREQRAQLKSQKAQAHAPTASPTTTAAATTGVVQPPSAHLLETLFLTNNCGDFLQPDTFRAIGASSTLRFLTLRFADYGNIWFLISALKTSDIEHLTLDGCKFTQRQNPMSELFEKDNGGGVAVMNSEADDLLNQHNSDNMVSNNQTRLPDTELFLRDLEKLTHAIHDGQTRLLTLNLGQGPIWSHEQMEGRCGFVEVEHAHLDQGQKEDPHADKMRDSDKAAPTFRTATGTNYHDPCYFVKYYSARCGWKRCVVNFLDEDYIFRS
ncbi:unnamed protein product [Amoebophrya sp. A120]|nr:unnamed protein product [Amoebophrya sp. A120]|eukprot:GSA120T00019831001.1